MGRHEHHTDWRLLLVYALVSTLVLVTGSTVLYLFFEKQRLLAAIAPDPLPAITILTTDPDSELAASWVKLLTSASFSPTLVAPGKFEPRNSLIGVCAIDELDSRTAAAILHSLESGGGLILLGRTPRLADLGISTTPARSDRAIVFGETTSPVLARLDPGYEVALAAHPTHVLEESSTMVVDARWKESSRAAIAHLSLRGGRIVWLGFDPKALNTPEDRQLALLLRTALRWAAGQPVSDGALGTATQSRSLAPEARMKARAQRLGFSVDRLESTGAFSVRIVNRVKQRIENPTVKLWPPPGTRSIRLSGSPYLRRKVSLTPMEDGSLLISLPSLGPYQERLMKLQAE